MLITAVYSWHSSQSRNSDYKNPTKTLSEIFVPYSHDKNFTRIQCHHSVQSGFQLSGDSNQAMTLALVLLWLAIG